MPNAFSVRWTGYLFVDKSATYTFSVRSDDGARLEIDGQLVVDLGGRHPSLTRSGTVALSVGSHFVLLDYMNEIGDYDVDWGWGADSDRVVHVPPWQLSSLRIERWRLIAARALDGAADAVLAAVLICGVWWLIDAAFGWIRDRARAHQRAATLVLFAALTAIETWPFAAHPARLSRNDNGDTVLNEWTLAWVAHQAPRAPLHLFDANIFYPERRALAYSESMMLQSAMAAPLLFLGASPVLAYNVVLLAGFTLTGWVMCLVVRRWTGDWAAGIAAGVIVAFNAHSFTRLPHLQAQHAEFLPLALMALDSVLREPRIGNALRLAAWFTLQALASIHFLVFTTVSLIAAALVRPRTWLGKRFATVVLHLTLAAIVATVVLLPYLLPYWRLSVEQGIVRTLKDATDSAASWTYYLSTPSRIEFRLWSHRWFSGPALFPGVLAIALASVAVATGTAFRDDRARMCFAMGACGFALSFGTRLPGYAVLHRFVPLLRVIRDVERFGYLVIPAVAVLAGFGVGILRRRVRASTNILDTGLLAALLVGLVIEPMVAPIHLVRFEGIPGIYAQLRDEPDVVVAEMPFWPFNAAFLHAPYMLNSTRHWKPMVNGYSGFQPLSFRRHAEQFASFPSSPALSALRVEGVTHVFVHLDLMGPAVAAALRSAPGLHELGVEGNIALYRVETVAAHGSH